jgi:ribulose-phosphate 3-epimerase
MLINPLKYIEAFAESGADIITFHCESASNTAETIAAIKACGKKAGLAVKPKTPVQNIFPYLDMIDMVLIMTVEPGFGGQEFVRGTIDKIKELSGVIKSKGADIPIQVDGGINGDTVAEVKRAGASVIVAGAYLYESDDMIEAVINLLENV